MAIMLPLPYFSSTQVVSVLKAQEIIGFLSFYPFRIHTVWHGFFVTMYNYHPLRLAKSNMPKQNFSHGVNVVCDGSPSRLSRVRRISLGITTRPRSSMHRTIPVAFIFVLPPEFAKRSHCYCLQTMGIYANSVGGRNLQRNGNLENTNRCICSQKHRRCTKFCMLCKGTLHAMKDGDILDDPILP